MSIERWIDSTSFRICGLALLAQAPGLTATRKLVLLALAAHADERGVARPGRDRLAAMTALNERTVRRCLADLQALGLIGAHLSRHKTGAWIVRLAALEALVPSPRPAVNMTLLSQMADLAELAGSPTTLALVLAALALRRRAPESNAALAARAGLSERAARTARDAAEARGLFKGKEKKNVGGRGKGGLILPGPAFQGDTETLQLCPANPASVSAKPCRRVPLTEERTETLTDGPPAPRPPERRQGQEPAKEGLLRDVRGPQRSAPRPTASDQPTAQPTTNAEPTELAALVDEIERLEREAPKGARIPVLHLARLRKGAVHWLADAPAAVAQHWHPTIEDAEARADALVALWPPALVFDRRRRHPLQPRRHPTALCQIIKEPAHA